MATTASPVKQRAALAPLDANAKQSLAAPKMLKDAKVSVIPSTGGASPLKRAVPATVSGTKRPAEDTCFSGNKKACVEENARSHRSRTSSPSTSSIFDTSAAEGDASWATTTTEPDATGAVVTDVAPSPAALPRRSMTREQAREKAEILRLRLGLASYKLRTGQISIPLADLQHKPLPPRSSVGAETSPRVAQDAAGKNRRTSSQSSDASFSSTSIADTSANANRPVQGEPMNEMQSHPRATSEV